ncbi:hypothetical protein OSB04_un000477 [Centaurea solstitialis]|uniref:Retrotransposon gag domain-containing protein n=1 Tax=Centaurea solstitialis TaxID=347529 RepID=A0AA38SHZ2_9ASTR|nr:hypothetical protein OSB04_un000477 [Centaurea solstitialis]
MPRLQHGELLPLDLEIEHTVKRRRRRRTGRNRIMAGNPPPQEETTITIADNKERGIRDYALPEFGQLQSCILKPTVDATVHFEPKPVMFQMISAMGQFAGLASEDPHSHLKSFLEMTDHFRIRGITTEHLRLTLFSYTLKDQAKSRMHERDLKNYLGDVLTMEFPIASKWKRFITVLLLLQKRGFETQLGQFANELRNRPPSTLPSDTETPKGKEHVKAVAIVEIGPEIMSTEQPCHTETRHAFDRENFPGLFSIVETPQEPGSVPKTAALPSSNAAETPVQTVQKSNQPVVDLRELPFPQRLKAKNMDTQFKKFLDIFKQLHINIPLVEALEQMPNYVKFLKDILNKKRRLSEFETVALTKECSALLTCKIPPKLKDPGSFTIPCSIGGKEVRHALCELGASVNLMPLSVFNKLEIGEVRPTTVTLQLADRSIVYPKGKIEDILVQVDKFIFPADFLVLDFEADRSCPIIVGQPFLATGSVRNYVQS